MDEDYPLFCFEKVLKTVDIEFEGLIVPSQFAEKHSSSFKQI